MKYMFYCGPCCEASECGRRFFWLDSEVVFSWLSCSSLMLRAAAFGVAPSYLAIFGAAEGLSLE